jgi:hypothetical protein
MWWRGFGNFGSRLPPKDDGDRDRGLLRATSTDCEDMNCGDAWHGIWRVAHRKFRKYAVLSIEKPQEILLKGLTMVFRARIRLWRRSTLFLEDWVLGFGDGTGDVPFCDCLDSDSTFDVSALSVNYIREIMYSGCSQSLSGLINRKSGEVKS